MRGLVDVRGRLEKVKKTREGRGRLMGVVLSGDKEVDAAKEPTTAAEPKKEEPEAKQAEKDEKGSLTELDRRLGELEDLIGSSSVALDEVCVGHGSVTHHTDVQYRLHPYPHPYFQCSRNSTPN